MSALLPCPFCGGEASIEPSMDDKKWTVWCPHEECGARSEAYGGTHDAAIAAWNRRAPSAEARAAAEEMRERAAEVADRQAADFDQDAETFSFNPREAFSRQLRATAARDLAAAIRALPLTGDEP